MERIAIYCGSSLGSDSCYVDAAKEIAHILSDNGIEVVYGGAKIGLMGVLADTMLASGAKVQGVMPKDLMSVEIAHEYLTKLHVVDSMHERKALMASLADGIILMPGGAGSLDEFFEMMTWAQLGFFKKPLAIYNVNNYFEHLLHFLDHCQNQGFLKSAHRHMLLVSDSAKDLVMQMKSYEYSMMSKW